SRVRVCSCRTRVSVHELRFGADGQTGRSRQARCTRRGGSPGALAVSDEDENASQRGRNWRAARTTRVAAASPFSTARMLGAAPVGLERAWHLTPTPHGG